MSSVTNKSAPITPVAVAQSYRFVVGVDTHAATHSYAVLDAAGALVDEQTFATTRAGIGRAHDWIARRTQGEIDSVVVAAEGTGSYGAVLAENLTEVGYRVVEAPTPRSERGRGKTDAMDAAILFPCGPDAGPACPPTVEDVRALPGVRAAARITTAIAPLLRTAKRSPAMPRMKALPLVAP